MIASHGQKDRGYLAAGGYVLFMILVPTIQLDPKGEGLSVVP